MDKSRSMSSGMNDNFFRQEEVTHGLNLYFKDTLGWSNINRFKLTCLGINNDLFKNDRIRVIFTSKQAFNKGVLCLEAMIKVKAKDKCDFITTKFKNNKELDLWTKPAEYLGK